MVTETFQNVQINIKPFVTSGSEDLWTQFKFQPHQNLLTNSRRFLSSKSTMFHEILSMIFAWIKYFLTTIINRIIPIIVIIVPRFPKNCYWKVNCTIELFVAYFCNEELHLTSRSLNWIWHHLQMPITLLAYIPMTNLKLSKINALFHN